MIIRVDCALPSAHNLIRFSAADFDEFLPLAQHVADFSAHDQWQVQVNFGLWFEGRQLVLIELLHELNRRLRFRSQLFDR